MLSEKSSLPVASEPLAESRPAESLPPGSPILSWQYWRHQLGRLTAGGAWTDMVPTAIRANFRWFWLDGVFSALSDSISGNYLTLFLLTMGVTASQIGMLSSVSSLTAAVMLIPGAAIVERLGHSRQVVLWGSTISRVMLLVLVILSFSVKAPGVVLLAIGLMVVRSMVSSIGGPAWICLSADIVPVPWRGRYFSARNIASSVAGMVSTYIFGVVITRIGAPVGYQVAMFMAFAIGMLSSYSFGRIQEPPPAARPAEQARENRLPALRQMLAQTDFLYFAGISGLWNVSVNFAGPFFPVYMVESLKATPAQIGILAIVSSLASLPGQYIFGRLADRWGSRRVLIVSSLLNPILPFIWMLTSSPWHVVPINLLGGFLWAGFNLTSFNILLAVMPEDRRPRFSAANQLILTLANAAGAALGGLFLPRLGYFGVFAVSGVGRLVSGVLFALLVREKRGRQARTEVQLDGN